jgi:hypothetical protein
LPHSSTVIRRIKVVVEEAAAAGMLEVMWVPVLLLHLGGQDSITAYNIEDNELWSRHLLTAVSQVTVAIYVFCESWPPDGDKRAVASSNPLVHPRGSQMLREAMGSQECEHL